MNLSDFFDTKSIIASLMSGGFVLFIAWLYKVDQKNKSDEKLRKFIFYEIFLLNSHLNDVMTTLNKTKKRWFRSQIVPGMKLTVFNNSKVQESLIGLKSDEVIAIIRFYNYYESIESKLILYCSHLQEKMKFSPYNPGSATLEDHEELLISSTEIITEDCKDINQIYTSISELKEFKKVVKDLNLS